MFKWPIAISLSPNTEKEDLWQALRTLFHPWEWKRGEEVGKVEQWFQNYFGAEAVSFNSGRSALLAILKSFNIGKGDEVIIQAFTCVAVAEPIIWVGAKPVFCDIDKDLNINSKKLEKYITPKTRAIIVQHTFGIPAEIELIKKITQKYNLVLIEDCAHSLGATTNGQKIGTFGDAAFFSFGRDKVISSVFGGIALINQKFKHQASNLRNYQEQLKYPSYLWICQQLFHPIAFAIILPLYRLYLGKLLIFILQKLHLLSLPVYEVEKKGEKPNIFPLKYPNALAQLLLVQLNKLDRYNQKRVKIANFYFEKLSKNPYLKLPRRKKGAIYLRFNLLTKEAEKILEKAKKEKILLGNWYRNIVDPYGVDYEKIGYKKGSCPQAEKLAKLSVNLPTYPRLKSFDLMTIVELINSK